MSDPVDLEMLAGRLTKAQRRVLLAMPLRKPKKWRALMRHAKVRAVDQLLPFRIAHPTLDGREMLTPLGLALRARLKDTQG